MRKKIFLKNLVLEHPERIFIPGKIANLTSASFETWLSSVRGNKPLVLDLGMGTGDFLLGSAATESDSFFLGIEVKKDRIAKAFRKAEALKLFNVGFLESSVNHLPRFAMPKAENIFLLFPDPWPKKRHAKRRMITKEYLNIYQSLLKPKGTLIFKTDDPMLFEEGLLNLKRQPWKLIDIQRDYKTPDHLKTAYEKRFLMMGKKVHYSSWTLP